MSVIELPKRQRRRKPGDITVEEIVGAAEVLLTMTPPPRDVLTHDQLRAVLASWRMLTQKRY